MTYEFILTPCNTVRLFAKFETRDSKIAFMQFSKGDFQRFNSISIWGNYDKHEELMLSWEFSTSLIPYLRERYEYMPNCITNLV